MRTLKKIPFWERAKKQIRAHKISQKNFAAYVGVSYGTFRDWICYGILPDASTACDIAAALGVTVEYLVNGTNGKAIRERRKEVFARKNAIIKLKKLAEQITKNVDLIG